MTPDEQGRSRERRWFLGTCLGLFVVVGGIVLIAYYSQKAKWEAEQVEVSQNLHRQASLVAEVNTMVADKAYNDHTDRFADLISPFLSFRSDRINAWEFILYELAQSSDGAVISHLFNTPEERKALVRYVERESGMPLDRYLRERRLRDR